MKWTLQEYPGIQSCRGHENTCQVWKFSMIRELYYVFVRFLKNFSNLLMLRFADTWHEKRLEKFAHRIWNTISQEIEKAREDINAWSTEIFLLLTKIFIKKKEERHDLSRKEYHITSFSRRSIKKRFTAKSSIFVKDCHTKNVDLSFLWSQMKEHANKPVNPKLWIG